MRNLLIFSLVLFFSTNTFVNHARSLEYTILDDTQVVESLELPLFNYWYGLYSYDEDGNEYKVGYVNMKEEVSENFSTYNEPVYINEILLVLEALSLEVRETYTIKTKTVFQTQPPYNFLYYEGIFSANLGEATVISTRQGDSLIIVKSDGENEKKSVITDFDYRLNHFLAVNIFFLKNINTKVGKKINLLEFDGDRFSDSTMKLLEIRNTLVDGVSYKYFVFESEWEEEDEIETALMFIDEDTKPIKINFSLWQVEGRLEAKEQAKDLSNLQEFFVLNMISVDQNIIEAASGYEDSGIQNIYFEIQGNYKNHFTNSFEQEVIYEDGVYYLGLGSDYGVWEEAKETDIKKNLEKRDFFDPIDDPKIISLAKQGTNGATTVEDKVKNLFSFVSDYIEDDMTIGNVTTVYDIINKKKGDCSEHAYLFNVLARSIGIPSQEVFGYAFDPESNTYTGHAWNEVAIDGYWYPVDPTWNEWLPSRSHIKSNEEGKISFNQLNLKLVKIEYGNGKEQFF